MNRSDTAFGLTVAVMLASNVWLVWQMRQMERVVSSRYDEWIEPLTSRLTVGSLWSEITTPRLESETSYDWTVRHMEAVIALRDRYLQRWGAEVLLQRYDPTNGNKPKEPK